MGGLLSYCAPGETVYENFFSVRVFAWLGHSITQSGSDIPASLRVMRRPPEHTALTKRSV